MSRVINNCNDCLYLSYFPTTQWRPIICLNILYPDIVMAPPFSFCQDCLQCTYSLISNSKSLESLPFWRQHQIERCSTTSMPFTHDESDSLRTIEVFVIGTLSNHFLLSLINTVKVSIKSLISSDMAISATVHQKSVLKPRKQILLLFV